MFNRVVGGLQNLLGSARGNNKDSSGGTLTPRDSVPDKSQQSFPGPAFSTSPTAAQTVQTRGRANTNSGIPEWVNN